MYAGSKYESHYTVWTAWISIRVRVRVGVYFILQNLAPPGTTVHVPTAACRAFNTLEPSASRQCETYIPFPSNTSDPWKPTSTVDVVIRQYKVY